eukprot:241771-Amphidinium_carterae.2
MAYAWAEDAEAWQHTGKAPTRAQWRVMNKGDAANPDVPSRLVVKLRVPNASMGQRVCSYTATSSFQLLDEQSSNFLQSQR